MRDRTEIAREMFEARQDLEQNLDRLTHRVRERLDVPARARHAIREFTRGHLAWIIASIAVASVMILGLVIWRARRPDDEMADQS